MDHLMNWRVEHIFIFSFIWFWFCFYEISKCSVIPPALSETLVNLVLLLGFLTDFLDYWSSDCFSLSSFEADILFFLKYSSYSWPNSEGEVAEFWSTRSLLRSFRPVIMSDSMLLCTSFAGILRPRLRPAALEFKML